MTLRQFVRFLLGYAAASIAVAGPGYLLSLVLAEWGVPVEPVTVVAALWFVTVGVSGLVWSLARLGRMLGHKPTPTMVVGQRSIPLTLSDSVRSIVSRRSETLNVADTLTLRCGGHTFDEDAVMAFLRKAWLRQRQGRAAFSRRYWLNKMDRERYDSLMHVLAASGLVVDRKPGASGRLSGPPHYAISELKSKAERHSPPQVGH